MKNFTHFRNLPLLDRIAFLWKDRINHLTWEEWCRNLDTGESTMCWLGQEDQEEQT